MNSSSLFLLIVGALLGAVVGFLLGKILRYTEVARLRKDAIKRSKSSILGEVSEKTAPLLPGFPYEAKDLVFVGKGFDYLILDGLSAGRLEKILFLEIKTGTSRLNQNERQIRDAIEAKRIAYTEWNPESSPLKKSRSA